MEFDSLLSFLQQLKQHNTKEWFDDHKKQYQQLRLQWLDFVAETIMAMSVQWPSIAKLEPKDCVFRINRDIRFSSDKSPYKTNFGMSLNPGGKKAPFCGYYLHIEPDNCFIAGGAYLPEPAFLAAIRQEIDYQFNQFTRIVKHPAFTKQFGKISGEALKRPPKGYDADNPAIEYLKLKTFIAQKALSSVDLYHPKMTQNMVQSFAVLKPLVDFLQAPLSEIKK
ncbi:MAG: DUF2461 domain-containing protein [Bacteroidia bacterium]|nr:DUF2461 domain-containing protein [Bacteroidia bacterium]